MSDKMQDKVWANLCEILDVYAARFNTDAQPVDDANVVKEHESGCPRLQQFLDTGHTGAPCLCGVFRDMNAAGGET